jgi:hypothetical protein
VESLDRLSRQSPYKAFRQFASILDMGVNIDPATKLWTQS